MTEPQVSAEEIAQLLGLKPLVGEGGRFARSYLCEETLDSGRAAGSAIYCLWDSAEPVSSLHRLDADEIWHLYLGGPMELLVLEPDGSHHLHVLGRDLLAGERPQVTVPAGCYMGARLSAGVSLALVGCTMSPAYVGAGFEIGDAEELARQHPAVASLVRLLARKDGTAGVPDEK